MPTVEPYEEIILTVFKLTQPLQAQLEKKIVVFFLQINKYCSFHKA